MSAGAETETDGVAERMLGGGAPMPASCSFSMRESMYADESVMPARSSCGHGYGHGGSNEIALEEEEDIGGCSVLRRPREARSQIIYTFSTGWRSRRGACLHVDVLKGSQIEPACGGGGTCQRIIVGSREHVPSFGLRRLQAISADVGPLRHLVRLSQVGPSGSGGRGGSGGDGPWGLS